MPDPKAALWLRLHCRDFFFPPVDISAIHATLGPKRRRPPAACTCKLDFCRVLLSLRQLETSWRSSLRWHIGKCFSLFPLIFGLSVFFSGLSASHGSFCFPLPLPSTNRLHSTLNSRATVFTLLGLFPHSILTNTLPISIPQRSHVYGWAGGRQPG